MRSVSRGVCIWGFCIQGICLQGDLHPWGSAYGGSAYRGVCLHGGRRNPLPRIRKVGGTHPTGMYSCYHSQNEVWGKVVFSEACVKNSVHRGHVWWGVACMAGRHAWQGACMAGGMHGGGHAWQGWHAWQGVCMVGGCVVVGGMCGRGGMHGGGCMAGGVHGWGHAWQGGMHGGRGSCVVAGGCVEYDEIRSMRGRYTSYWNAFLLNSEIVSIFGMFLSCWHKRSLLLHDPHEGPVNWN